MSWRPERVALVFLLPRAPWASSLGGFGFGVARSGSRSGAAGAKSMREGDGLRALADFDAEADAAQEYLDATRDLGVMPVGA